MKDYQFKKGERVAIIAGKWAGRNGEIAVEPPPVSLRQGVTCVLLDPKPGEKTPKKEYVSLNSLLPEVKL